MDTITQDHGIFYTTSQLSDNMETTPEGYLLCKNVPVARTGTLFYGPGELPRRIIPGISGGVEVERTADELFSPVTIASANGKSVTLLHPLEMLTAKNSKTATVGVVLNPRRGEGEENDRLFTDLLIKDQESIDNINNGTFRQVSCGSRAQYEQLGPGRARQRSMIINHVALVPKGRCGPSCAIRDEQREETNMADDSKIAEAEKAGMEKGFMAALKALFSGGKIPAADAEAKPGTDKAGDMAKVLDGITSRLDALEKVAPKGTTDAAAAGGKTPATMDAATTADLMASAGIIQPGFKPSGAAVLDAAVFKREVLAAAYAADTAKAGFIEAFTGKTPDFGKLEGAALDAAFIGAREVLRVTNNAKTFSGIHAKAKDGAAEKDDPASRFDKAAKEMWASK